MDDLKTLDFIPGAAHGITSVVLGHPMDTAKTRMQALGPRATRSFLSTIGNMTREEGVRSLYRGVTPPLVMSSIKRSLQFAAWNVMRNHEKSEVRHTIFERMSTWIGASSFRSGALAGAMGTVVGCPMHVIKIRTQYLTCSVTRNAWTCALDIFYREGLSGYYRGFRYHLLKDTLFASCYFGMYDTSKVWLHQHFSKSQPNVNRPDSINHAGSQMTFFAGCISAMVTWIVLYPLDTVKTIVQARNVGIRQVSQLFARDKSLMYRGVGASLARSGPVGGVAMVVYEFVKNRTDHRRRRHQHENYMNNS